MKERVHIIYTGWADKGSLARPLKGLCARMDRLLRETRGRHCSEERIREQLNRILMVLNGLLAG